MTKLGTYFTLAELTASKTAKENGIENKPSVIEIGNLSYLVKNLLDPLRVKYGKPITITSGYRNLELNALVKGQPTSQHTKGEAADCYCVDGPETLKNVLLESGLDFDQAIVYTKRNFLHLSLTSNRKNRKELLYNHK